MCEDQVSTIHVAETGCRMLYIGHAEEYLPESLQSLGYLVRPPAKEGGSRQPMPHGCDRKMLSYILWVGLARAPCLQKG